MKLQNETIPNQSVTSSIFMQDLAIEMQETITGGDGTCTNCSVKSLWLEDDDAVASSGGSVTGGGIIRIQPKGR